MWPADVVELIDVIAILLTNRFNILFQAAIGFKTACAVLTATIVRGSSCRRF